MAKAKKKTNVLGLVLTGIVLLGLVMAIVGVCIDYVNITGSAIIGGSKTEGSTLGELADRFKDIAKDNQPQMWATMQTFAYLTVALTGVTTILYLVTRFFNVKLFKLLTALLALLTIVSAIVAIATAYGFCNKNSVDIGVAAAEYAPAAGAWLLAIFSILGGGSALVGAMRK